MQDIINSNIITQKYIMVLDTETTGLPLFSKYHTFYNPKDFTKYDISRVIEIGYYIYNIDGDIIKKNDILIKPSGFKIENSEIHGITNENADINGVPLINALEQFYIDLYKCDTIIAHNLKFDMNIILAECYRNQKNNDNNISIYSNIINKMSSMKQICTIQLAKDKLKLEKRIKLIDLYKMIIKKDWIQKHRAEDDARICAECYWHLLQI